VVVFQHDFAYVDKNVLNEMLFFTSLQQSLSSIVIYLIFMIVSTTQGYTANMRLQN